MQVFSLWKDSGVNQTAKYRDIHFLVCREAVLIQVCLLACVSHIILLTVLCYSTTWEKCSRKPLVCTSKIYTDQLMCTTLLHFRNHTPVQCIMPPCRQVLRLCSWQIWPMESLQRVTEEDMKRKRERYAVGWCLPNRHHFCWCSCQAAIASLLQVLLSSHRWQSIRPLDSWIQISVMWLEVCATYVTWKDMFLLKSLHGSEIKFKCFKFANIPA